MEARKRTVWAALLGLVVVAGAMAALRHFTDLRLPGWATALLMVVTLAVAAVSTWTWWKLLDEVAREAHKFAWYWGASAGMVVAGAVVVLVESHRIAPPLMNGPDISDGFAAGAITVLACQIAGYLIAWVGWWWSRR